MKVVKPLRLSLLTRTLEHVGRKLFVVTGGVFFSLGETPGLHTEVELWKLLGTELDDGTVFDLGYLKPRAEVLVWGTGYAPGGRPRAAVDTRVSIATVDKSLRCVGPRRWSLTGSSAPEPFTSMPLRWSHAYGGPGFPENPVGTGFPQRPTSAAPLALPTVEDPRRPVRSPDDQHPASYAPIDLAWRPRMDRAGTYDARWFAKGYPGLAEDAELGMFNAAPEDQQLDGYFQGDEAFVLENLHPAKPRLTGRLPGVTVRVLVERRLPSGTVQTLHGTRLDTVWLFPHAERGVALFRAVLEVAEDDAWDVQNLLLACEPLGERKPQAHYQTVLAERLDKSRGALLSLRDADLMPPNAVLSGDASDTTALVKTDQLLTQNLRRRAERDLEERRAHLRAAGVDPDRFLPAALPPQARVTDDPEAMIAQVTQASEQAHEALASAEERRREALDGLRASLHARGFNLDALQRAAGSAQGGPPKFRAAAAVAQLTQAQASLRSTGRSAPAIDEALAQPELLSRLEQVESELQKLYRRFAHHQAEAPRMGPHRAETIRAWVVRRLAQSRDLAREDLTGADLRGLELSGVDLSGAFLERAVLCGANLRGANLRGAVLARADLTGATLDQAVLTEANLGKATLREASLVGAALGSAVLSGADCTAATLRDADASGAELLEVCFTGATLSGLRLPKATLLDLDLAGATLDGAVLTEAVFVRVNLTAATLSGAMLSGATFLDVRAEGASFRGATMEKFRAVRDCKLAGADFSGARMMEANLRALDLRGASFAHADLRRADLSEAQAAGVSLHRADAREARFARTDLTDAECSLAHLMDAVFERATIQGASFRGANLHRADFARVRGGAKDLSGALLTRVRVVPRSDHGQS